MAYTRVADPLLNSAKPGRATDWKQIRDNQDWFDAQIAAFTTRALISNNSIIDDFLALTLNSGVGGVWTSLVGGTGTNAIIGEHSLESKTTAAGPGDYAGVVSQPEFQRIIKTEEYVAVFESRLKITGSLEPYYFLGWNDPGLAGNSFADISDSVGVGLDPAGKVGWEAGTYIGGGGGALAPFGTAANWNIVRCEFTCSAVAGNRQAEFFLNGASQGTLSVDANMPAISLRPTVGCDGNAAGATRGLKIDYLIFTVQARPVAA